MNNNTINNTLYQMSLCEIRDEIIAKESERQKTDVISKNNLKKNIVTMIQSEESIKTIIALPDYRVIVTEFYFNGNI